MSTSRSVGQNTRQKAVKAEGKQNRARHSTSLQQVQTESILTERKSETTATMLTLNGNTTLYSTEFNELYEKTACVHAVRPSDKK